MWKCPNQYSVHCTVAVPRCIFKTRLANGQEITVIFLSESASRLLKNTNPVRIAITSIRPPTLNDVNQKQRKKKKKKKAQALILPGACKKNKAVYTTALVAGGWAGAVMIWAGAVMIWAGAVMIWAGACSNTNFPTLETPKNAKKAKCDRQMDHPTDQRMDRPTR